MPAGWLKYVKENITVTHTILTDSLTDLVEVCCCGCLCVNVYVCLRKQSVCKMFTVLLFSIAVISCACGYLCVCTYALGTRMLKCLCVCVCLGQMLSLCLSLSLPFFLRSPAGATTLIYISFITESRRLKHKQWTIWVQSFTAIRAPITPHHEGTSCLSPE